MKKYCTWSLTKSIVTETLSDNDVTKFLLQDIDWVEGLGSKFSSQTTALWKNT